MLWRRCLVNFGSDLCASAHRVKALLDGVFVGFAAGEKHGKEKIGWITTVGVLPAFRGQGIGKKLIRDCEENLSMPKIHLTVDVSNVDAIRLYESLHYQSIEIWTRYYASGHDALLMEKTL